MGSDRGGLTASNFFSYFTVLSNSFAAVTLTMLATRPRLDNTAGVATIRGAMTVYMSVTGLIYALVLAPAGVDVGLTEPWVDNILHISGPLLILADWIINPPTAHLETKVIWLWLLFPGAYLTYTLIRGPFADWYPYPILDPIEQSGYEGVALWSLIVTLVVVGFGVFFRWWANRAPDRPQMAVS